ncbi:high affinity cGMP-specific 3',5'-cyclic phosphodiesterase 9A-like [Oratosquilla oratoria]|uniref:high affinity cGMP-specific 3',5'-cyclic phosphodiesterase 9A-like n=1 Tax=Oratosquilla oratoria TaxID=337810 RepID=UPI003F75DAA4
MTSQSASVHSLEILKRPLLRNEQCDAWKEFAYSYIHTNTFLPTADSLHPERDEAVSTAVAAVAQQLHKVFRVDELRADLGSRLAALEKRLDRDSKRVIEIEKFKYEIADIRDAFLTHHRTRHVDFTRLSTVREHVISLQRDVPSFKKYDLSHETTEQVKQPTFDVWQWEPNEMLALIEHMYKDLGLLDEFSINPVTLRRFLVCVQENYRNNPFHNFRHCFCVTQMMYGLIHLCRLTEKMSRRDLGVLLTACICHDLDHPGYNNTYQINARTELAVRYNDNSPLENHHCAVAFRILANPECNIFSNVPEQLFIEIRAEVIMLVLATDMARHSEILDDFRKKLEVFDLKNSEHMTSLKMILIKACDISNEVRPIRVAEPWVECLLEEYFNQAETEKQEGLPVAPFMDREKVTKSSAQISFIKFVLIPLFECLAQLFNQVNESLLLPLRHTKEYYERQREAEEEARRLNMSKSVGIN